MKKVSSVAISIVFLLLFVIYFGQNTQDFKKLLEVNVFGVIAICILHIVIIFFDGIFLKFVLNAFDKNISHLESFYTSLISRSGNYLTPFRGGTGLRAFYIKKNFAFNYSNFISMLTGYYLIMFMLNSILALAALVMIYFSHGYIPELLYLLFGGVFLLTFIVMFTKIHNYLIKKISFVPKISKIGATVNEGLDIIKDHPHLLRKLIILSILYIFTFFLMFWIEFLALGISVSIAAILLYTTMSNISILISLTPGSIGIRESFFLIFSTTLGITSSEIIQVAVLDRSILFFLLIILLIIFRFVNFQRPKVNEAIK